jgi:hypothetical protein
MSTLPVVVTVRNASGLTTTGNATINVTDVAPVSLFTTQTPTQPSVTDTPSPDYELGMRFSASTNGTITGIRYWKATSETGTHTGRIWSNTGTLLASVVFTGETASGWQTKALATPLSITAGTQYVVSVNVNARYAVTTSGFANAISNAGLAAPVGAGVFNEAPGLFPASSYQSSNYFRDVVFVAGALTAPVVTAGNFNVSLPATSGQVVGTMTATQAPTSWAITAGNGAGYLSISNAGVITTTSAIVAGSYSLTCRATNAAGNGTGAASITAAVPVAGTIPITFNDPMFTGMTENPARVFLSSGQALTRRSIQEQSGNPTITHSGPNTISFCRVNSRECVRINQGNLTIDSCYFESTGVEPDHADTLQAYSPGARGGTVTITNSHIRAHNTAATAGYFTADNWGGTIVLNNVIFQGGPYGFRCHADGGAHINISFNNVFFISGSFGDGSDNFRFLIGDNGGTHTITAWNNVRNATIVNGVLVPGSLIPSPG